jgi:S1-C subfamily serine protease
MRFKCLMFVAFAVGVTAAAAAQPQKQGEQPKPAAAKQWFVDDEKLFEDFMGKLTDLAKAGKCLAHDKMLAAMKFGTKAKVTPAKPSDRALSPEEVYKVALPSVFVVGSVYKDKDGEWQDGLYATAWVAAADGVLVTNWHVFEDLEAGEVFGATDHQGNVYPMTEFLGGDKVADIAVIRIDAKGLTPLAVAEELAPVGSWVGVLSHTGDNFYVYTTGAVTRYSTNKNDAGKRERWMGVTSEYAGGSSGAPLLNRNGAVVGMAALTLTIEDGGVEAKPAPMRRRLLSGQPPKKGPPKKDDPKPKDKENPKEKPEALPPAVQMILKMAVPGPTIRKSFAE